MPSNAQQDTAALLSTFFKGNPLPSFIVEAGTLQIIAANKKAAALLQYSTATLQGMTLTQLTDAAHRPALLQMVQQQSHPAAWSRPLHLLDSNGQLIALYGYFSSYVQEGGTYLQVVATRAENQPAPGANVQPDSDSCKINLMASLVSESEDILTAADLHYKPVSWNGAAERIFGLSAAQALGADISDLLNLHYVGTNRGQVRKVIAAEGQWRGELTFVRPADGRQVTLFIAFKKLFDVAQEHIGYLVFGTDITIRKEEEFKLKEIEDRFRGVADAAPVGIWMSDKTNRLTYVNKPMLDFSGLSAETFTNASWAARLHPEDVEKTKEKFKKHFWKKRPVRLIYRFKNNAGEYRWVQDNGMPRYLEDGQFIGYIGSIIDITESKKREEQLQYQAWVLENVQDIVITTGLDETISSWNKVAERTYGYTAAQAIGRPIHELVKLRLVACTLEEARQELNEKGIWKGEVVYEDAQGRKCYFLHTVSYFIDAVGNRTGILDVGRDITERKKAAEKLEQSELFYRNLIADSLDGILLCDTAPQR